MTNPNFLRLLEDAPPPGEKRVAVIIGRFNPPTRGHYEVISKVKSFIKKNPDLHLDAIPVVMVIGGSKADNDKAKNPLTVDERIAFMKASGHADGVKFMTAKNAFEALTSLRSAGLEPIAVAAGQERIGDYMRILDNYFKDVNDKPIKHYKIALGRDEEAVETDAETKQSSMDKILDDMKNGDDLSTDLVSGSLARRAAELGYEDEFADIVGLEHNKTLAKKLYQKVRAALPKDKEE